MRPQNYTYGNKTYDLRHLSPNSYKAQTVYQPNLSVKVSYSCHCFTVGASIDGHRNPTYTIEGEERFFCTHRYTLSQGLPALLVRAIQAASSFKVFTRYDRNGAVNYAVLDDPNSDQTYSAFFDVAKDNLQSNTVRMIIKSAYVSDNYKKSSRDKTNLGTLFDKTMGVHPVRRNHKRKKRKK